MELQDIIDNHQDAPKLLSAVKAENTSAFSLETYKQYKVANHAIFDKIKRPDKWIMKPNGLYDAAGNPLTTLTPVPVTRSAVSLQKLLVRRISAFISGGAFSMAAVPTGTPQQNLFNAVSQVWDDNKLDFESGGILERLLSETEVCEIWETDVRPDNTVSLRMGIYSPSDGYTLHPIFNTRSNMVAFGLEYEAKAAGKTVKYLDLYTDTQIFRYSNALGGWTFSKVDTHKFGKIPVVYYKVPEVFWDDVQTLIERFETAISNFSDTNDYNGSPILYAKGTINGFAAKGEAGKVIEGSADSDLKYVTWESAPEAIKMEIDLLLRLIFSGVQVPDISFDALRNLGDVSGVAFAQIMIDAHLCAIRFQNGAYGKGIQRRINFLKAACCATNNIPASTSVMSIKPKFGLFTIDDLPQRVGLAIKANGGKAVMSQKESIEYVGISDDADKTLDAIKAETIVIDPKDPKSADDDGNQQ